MRRLPGGLIICLLASCEVSRPASPGDRGLADIAVSDAPPAGWTRIPCGTREDLASIWGSSSSNIFIGGYKGTLFHFDGKTCKAMKSGLTERIAGIWGSGPKDVYAVSAAHAIHFDGKAWKPISGLGGTAVWGTGPDDVLVTTTKSGRLGHTGVVRHFDGKVWGTLPIASIKVGWFTDVWASGPNDVWLTYWANSKGYMGMLLYHHDGKKMSQVKAGDPFFTFNRVWGTGPADLYLVGRVDGTIARYNGKKWSEIGPPAYKLYSSTNVWASSKTDAYFLFWDYRYPNPPPRGNALVHFDGVKAWKTVATWPSTPKLNALWGTKTHLYVVGGTGAVYRRVR